MGGVCAVRGAAARALVAPLACEVHYNLSWQDAFFDKTIQTLVHEHLPLGVLMIFLSPESLVSRDEQAVINGMACEMFGFTRPQFIQTLADIRGPERYTSRRVPLGLP